MFTKGRLDTIDGKLLTKFSKIVSRLYEILNEVDETTAFEGLDENITFSDAKTNSLQYDGLNESITFGDTDTNSLNYEGLNESITFSDSETNSLNYEGLNESINITNES